MKNYQFGNRLADGQYQMDISPENIVKAYLQKFFPENNNETYSFIDEKGIYIIRKQLWDSAFFGFSIARIEVYSNPSEEPLPIKELIDWAKKQNIRYLTARLSSSDSQLFNSLSSSGFTLLTNKYMLRLKNEEKTNYKLPSDMKFRILTSNDLNPALKLAENSFTFSRFFIDSAFENNRVKQMYVSWLSDFLRQTNHFMLGLYFQSTLIGFCAYTLGINLYSLNAAIPNHGFIALIAVDKDFRGRGFGKFLLNKVRENLRKDNTQIIYANVDAENQGSLKMFQEAGFKVFNVLSEMKLDFKLL